MSDCSLVRCPTGEPIDAGLGSFLLVSQSFLAIWWLKSISAGQKEGGQPIAVALGWQAAAGVSLHALRQHAMVCLSVSLSVSDG